jgi:hypothetical protein
MAPAAPVAPVVQSAPRQVVRVANGGEIDYSQYEAPAVQRQGGASGPQQSDLLNVPAFLRRQAD